MKLDKFFQFFVVKERKYYPLFISLAECSQEAADDLFRLIQDENHDNRVALYKKIKATESRADKITASIYNELRVTFVTPFDREDINHLSSRLDTFIDFVHDAARKIVMYNPKKLNEMYVLMGKYIQEDAHILCEIMELLEFLQKKNEVITLKCNRIHEIEHACDDLYEQIMEDVFSNEKDAIELVRLKNVVQALEDSTDRAKETIDVIRSVIIKFV